MKLKKGLLAICTIIQNKKNSNQQCFLLLYLVYVLPQITTPANVIYCDQHETQMNFSSAGSANSIGSQ